MKNILLIIPKLSNGGAERAITLLANTLKADYNVKMVVFDNSIKEYTTDVEVIDLKTPKSKSFIKKLYNFLIRVRKVKNIKKELKIDCTISYLPGSNIVNCFSKQKDKTIISIRNMQSKLKKSFLRDIVNKISIKKADRIVTVSKIVEEDIKQNYHVDANKIVTIYNMIDSFNIEKKKAEEVEEKDIFFNDEIKIINIGRLIPQKGQWHLIKAFKIIQARYPKAKLIILGRGELENDLKNLIEKLDLKKNVFLLNFKTNPYKYMANSNIFVSTSIYEGMPNVVLEAMACGLPVIGTDCLGGTKEILEPKSDFNQFTSSIVEGEYGVLVPALSEECDFTESISGEEISLANEIIKIIKDDKKMDFYEHMSKERIRDFENNKIKQEWVKVISN